MLKLSKLAARWGRSMQHVDAEVLAFEGYTLDLTRGCVRNESAEIELRPKSFELLRYLVSNRGRLISKDELVTAVWPHVIVSDDSLAQCISDIRRALNDPDRRIIKTVPRRGYLFAATLSVPPRDHAIDQRAGDISDAAEQDPGAEGGLALAPASSNQQGHFTKTRRLAYLIHQADRSWAVIVAFGWGELECGGVCRPLLDLIGLAGAGVCGGS
jgi:DNA-binding winged helix-turn-helix (wHTH) protein